jgi:hypothetical protein
MHYTMVVAAMILALRGGTFADNCNSETLFELDGNEYCTAVQAIKYKKSELQEHTTRSLR